MKTRYLALLATLAFLGFSVPAAAHDCDGHKDKTHKHCPGDPTPEPSGGGKALLFESAALCGGATNTTGPSYGNVSWAGNVLWDPNFIHVHLKLQLKDVDPLTYDTFGNFDPACGTKVDSPLCEGGNCEIGHVSITVKQNNQQGRTNGVLRIFPHQPAGTLVTVWVTVPVTVMGVPKILRSTPVTMELPPNAVGCGDTPCPE